MTDAELEQAIGQELARQYVDKHWPGLRADLIETNIDMVYRLGHGNFNPSEIAATAVRIMRSNSE